MAARGPVHLPPPLHGELAVNDLSVVGDEMWAVGMHGAPAPALVGHSTGGTPWALVPYPGRSGAAHTQLAGVHARAHDDVWAVGWEGLFHTHTERAHIAHHDGTTWRSIQSPDHGDGSHLAGVAAWARELARGAVEPLEQRREGDVTGLGRRLQDLAPVVTDRAARPLPERCVGHGDGTLGWQHVGRRAQSRPGNADRRLCGRPR